MGVPAKDFEKIYSEHYAEIRRFIFTIARRDPDITDDISQNTWQNAYSYFGSLRKAESVRAWLYAIARNEAKRYFANRHVAFFQKALILGDEDAPVDMIDETESDFPEALVNADLITKLMALLSDDEQRLILLYYAYDVELKEVAEIGGVNYNTVKSTLRRAIGKLRKAAAEMDIGGSS